MRLLSITILTTHCSLAFRLILLLLCTTTIDALSLAQA